MELQAIGQIFLASMLLESIWETIKMAIDSRSNRDNLVTKIGTIVLGIFLAFSYSLDLLALLGLHDHIPYSGIFLSGILISRGSNFVHDLLIRLGTFKEQIAILTPIGVPKVPEKITPIAQVTPVKEVDPKTTD